MKKEPAIITNTKGFEMHALTVAIGGISDYIAAQLPPHLDKVVLATGGNVSGTLCTDIDLVLINSQSNKEGSLITVVTNPVGDNTIYPVLIVFPHTPYSQMCCNHNDAVCYLAQIMELDDMVSHGHSSGLSWLLDIWGKVPFMGLGIIEKAENGDDKTTIYDYVRDSDCAEEMLDTGPDVDVTLCDPIELDDGPDEPEDDVLLGYTNCISSKG